MDGFNDFNTLIFIVKTVSKQAKKFYGYGLCSPIETSNQIIHWFPEKTIYKPF